MSTAASLVARICRSPRAAFLTLVAPLATASLVAQARPDSARPGAPDPGPLKTIEFETSEGTWMSVDVSPDGRTLLFDLLGDLYTMPITGGDAKLIWGGRDWAQTPRFSPDGKSIAFISDKDGQLNLWIANADGSSPRQITRERTGKAQFPTWTPDGRYVVVMSGDRPNNRLRMFHKDGGTGIELPIRAIMVGTPTFSPDGRFLYVSTGAGAGARNLVRLDRSTNTERTLTGRQGGFKPVASPDGKWLAYGRKLHGKTEIRFRDLSTGAERTVVPEATFDDSEAMGAQDVLPNYAFTPDGSALILAIGGKLHRVTVATGADQVIPMKVKVSLQVVERLHVEKRVDDGPVPVKILRWPTLSKDGRRLAFSAVGQIWTMDLPNGKAKRLTTSTDNEYSPAYSPDGRWIAYTTWTDTVGGHLMIAPAEGGAARRVTRTPGHYANPSWSPDGSKIAFVRGTGAEFRQELPGEENAVSLVWSPATGGEPTEITLASMSGYDLRYHPMIYWTPDASRIYYVEHGDGDFLKSARLDGTEIRTHVHMKWGEELVPSPDGTRFLIGRRDEAWLADLPPYGASTLAMTLGNGPIPAKRVSPDGATFISWVDDSSAVWTFGGKVYRYRMGTDKPEMIADVGLTVPRDMPGGTVAFKNARIVTMKGQEVIAKGTIVVKGNRITAIGPNVAIPSGATVVDATGQTIIPGLIDVHDHVGYADWEIFPKQRWELIANLAYGVTTAFDPSNNSTDAFAQGEMIAAGRMLGPRLYSSGDVVLGDVSSAGGVAINGIEDARRVLKWHKAYGTEMLKQYMQPRRDQRQWMAQAAREAGVAITAEGGGDLFLDLTMAIDGYTAVEHAPPAGQPVQDDVAQLLARTGTHYTPTLTVVGWDAAGTPYWQSKVFIHDDAKLRRFTPEASLERSRRPRQFPENEWLWKMQSEGSAKIMKAGGMISMGAHGDRDGLGSQWELWNLQAGGLSNYDALRTATIIPAMKLGRDKDLGSLEVGKLADFLVLGGNPLDDIKNTAKMKYVVANGFVYDAESMTRVWPDLRPLDRFSWQTPADQIKFAAPKPTRLK